MAEIRKWSGIRNTDSPERLKLGEMTVATDVDINNSMKVISRKGQTLIDSTAAHSLYELGDTALIVHGSTLKMTDGSSFSTVASLSSSSPVSYDVLAGTVYYSNGTDKGRVIGSTARQWGITPPTSQPIAQATAGVMQPGRYMYAITYIRDDDQESGTGLAGLIELSTVGGILFTGITPSTDSSVSGIMLYVSSTNGEILFRVAFIPNGQTIYQMTSDTQTDIPLITQFLEPPPAGTIVRYYLGKMYVVKDNLIYMSKPYQPELFDLANDFMQFDSNVTMFECVNSGCFIGTETETGYTDNDKYTTLFDYGVIPGTAVKTLASKFETAYEGESRGEQAGEAVIWTSKGHGVCLGKEGGAAVNLTSVRYGMGDADSGSGVVIEENGFNKYVVVLRGEATPNNIYVGD